MLQGADYDERDPLVDVRLAELRRDAFAELDRDLTATRWPPDFEDPFPGETGLIELSKAEATPELVGGAIQHHGCVLVRGLVAPDVAEHLREMVESAVRRARGAPRGRAGGRHGAVLRAAPAPPGLPAQRPNQIEGRADLRWFRVCTIDSPRPMFEVIDAYEKAGIGDIVRGWLDARPVLTGGKWALRRMPKRKISGWHQEAQRLPEGADPHDERVARAHRVRRRLTQPRRGAAARDRPSTRWGAPS